jgi:hypothetical protein
LNVYIKATPHKARLKALYWICLHIFRHLAQKSLDIRQYACEISIQSDEKSVGASPAQALCGIAYNKFKATPHKACLTYIKNNLLTLILLLTKYTPHCIIIL